MFSGSGGGNATRINGVQINASNFGKPVPIVYGQGRCGTSVIWYDNFQSHAQSQGGKGGGGVVSYTYTADVLLAVCEGTISDLPVIYKDRGQIAFNGTQTALQQEGLTFSNGAQNQAPWAYLVSNYPSVAFSYAGTAWVARASMALDSSGGVPNYNFEVKGIFQYGVGGIVDAQVADVIVDQLTNPRYGIGYPSSGIADLTDFRNYCIAADFFISPVLIDQQQLQNYISDWVAHCNSEVVWSQGQIKLIPYGDEPITGNGVTWTPNVTPVVYLTDDDYIVGGTIGGGSPSDDPVQVTRTSPSDQYNNFRIEYLDRGNNYNAVVVPSIDQARADLYGLRTADVVSAHEICVASRAQHMVQLLKQRSIYITNQYVFTLPVNYCYLEPMDIVAISDTLLRYNQKTVRIKTIEEDDNLNLKVTAEDFFVGVGTAIPQDTQAYNNFMPNVYSEPGDVSAPFMFLPPAGLIGSGSYQLWIAVAGTNAAWGGCTVYASFDNATYSYIGVLNGRSTYGQLTALFPSGTDPDTTNTLSIDLSASLGVVDPVNTTIADAGGSACMVGSEIIDYTGAVLTSAYNYNMNTYIRRGQLGTTISSHAIGSRFAVLNGFIFKYPYTSASAGKTLYLKFSSFNVYGGQNQDLSGLTAYSITL